MKFESINKRYTETVAEWMAKGYYINAATMCGHQGEISKIDLTNGKEIIRICLESENNACERIEDHFYSFESIRLVVGCSTDNVKPNDASTWNALWTSHLEIISTEDFYKIGDRRGSAWYGTREDAIAQQDAARDRAKARETTNEKDLNPSQTAKILLPFLKRQPKCKHLKPADITRVWKVTNRKGTAACYMVQTSKGKTYRLH